MRFVGILFICIATLLNGCVISNRMNFEEGIRSFQIQNYREAFIRLMPIAKAGNPDAQYAVGYMYYYGEGVVENREKAWYWIKCAAKSGQADAVRAMQILTPPVK